jgi:hypothetical protein
VALAGIGFAIACVAANASRPPAVQHYSTRPVSTSSPTGTLRPDAGDVLEKPPRPHHWHLGMPDWLLRSGLTLLLGIAALLAILLIIRLVPKLERRPRRAQPEEPEEESDVHAPPLSPDQVSQRMSNAVDDALDAFRRGDRERAIIACWIRLEQIAEEAGFARLSSETSSELAGRWLTRLPVSRQPLLTLAALYREARYSSHQLDEPALVTARGALEQLRSEISSSSSVFRSP